jgi:SAM-dependent methyltransferase
MGTRLASVFSSKILEGMRRNQEYDPFAWLYTTYWGEEFHRQSLAVLDRLILGRLPRRASVLDLCCGDGRMSQQLVRRGYAVMGLDSSDRMLEFAKQRAPKAEFILADARRFNLPERFAAVVSTFDSLNHVCEPRDLAAVFRNVFGCLKPSGLFAFDLNREEAYRDLWARTSHTIDEDAVSIARGCYSSRTKLAHCDVTLFRPSGKFWERSDFRLTQKYHPEAEIVAALEDAGFVVEVHDARDLGMQGDIGFGRTFFLGRKIP